MLSSPYIGSPSTARLSDHENRVVATRGVPFAAIMETIWDWQSSTPGTRRHDWRTPVMSAMSSGDDPSALSWAAVANSRKPSDTTCLIIARMMGITGVDWAIRTDAFMFSLISVALGV